MSDFKATTIPLMNWRLCKMSDPISKTTRPDPEGAIAFAIWPVCGDGNSNPYRVATDVIRSLDRHGYRIVDKDETP